MQQPLDPAAPARPRGRRRIPVAVYGAAILLLLVAVFLARGFTREVGDARVSGRFSVLPLLHSRVPEQLALTWNGLTLRFARGTTPSLRGFEAAGAGTDLVFDDGARLRLAPGADTGGSLSLTPVGSGGAAGETVVVPFAVEGVMLSPPPGAALAWRRSGREFLLTLPEGARTDVASSTLTLPLSGAASAVLRVQGVAAASRPITVSPVATRLPQESAMPSADRLQAALGSWEDAAWRGWSASRYSAAAGAWRLPDGSTAFSEDIGIALCAESVSRGAWQTAFPLWADALSRQRPGAPPLLATSAYVGGERDFARAYRARTAAVVTQAGAALSRGDASALSVPGLVTLLLDHGSADQLTTLAAFLGSRTSAGLDLNAALGFVQAGLDYLKLVRADDALARQVKDTVEKRILPAVRSVEAGVFLDAGGGRVDLRLSLAAGALLVRAGAGLGSSLYAAVGRGLLVSGLALADDGGFLPAGVSLGGGRVTSREGTLAPEALYTLLPLDRPVPREIPLAAVLGPGAWIWTPAGIASATGSASGASLVFSYPRGVPYHFVIGGLKPFAQLKLHGIPWHSDPTYFKYSDGWDYDQDNRTLLMKITGRADQEQIDISF